MCLVLECGEKGDEHCDPADPPRRRANKWWGRGTYANDRHLIVGTIGRESGQVRLRVVSNTTGPTLCGYTHQFTQPTAQVYTDEYDSYHQLKRAHTNVCHAIKEWARDDDGDGIREVHTNTDEGMWTGVRTFLRPFRGVHKRYLSGYISMCEFGINLKRISLAFLSAFVRVHTFQT